MLQKCRYLYETFIHLKLHKNRSFTLALTSLGLFDFEPCFRYFLTNVYFSP